MITRPVKYAWQHIRYVPLWSMLTVSRWRSFRTRSAALGRAVGGVMRWFPIARRRVNRDLKQVFPEMSRQERNCLRRQMGRNMGQTLFEIYHNAEFHTRLDHFHVSGPGLKAIEAAQAAGKGAIIVSGHFGQWEAVRASLKARGIEVGAVYRRQSNRHYQRRLLAGIEAGGLPIMETGRVGTKTLVRHLRSGGVVAILLDEKHPDGARLPFLGRPALTSLAAAQLALKYDIPMVPAYGTRIGDGSDFAVEYEAPIPHSDAKTMTAAFNDSLSARIRAHPDQWYWLLNRWQGA
ncbi:lysophospholipid acyltransferase family protein [Parasedimentitalea psychrophila]|uniref:Lysophospholipid acyltransferase family protein n=1 Tax=Parasedimentitalea psychrophila TaxID=2997337 RepID=A0A9Y2L2D4_9RHOB|nr:lysophospholipid acyltransferase family protein [Parasedimentitalea psychrophila]WIY26873.1 lysophospholipid acyltransferase family protein [Parasedimentitalea psychrophila]